MIVAVTYETLALRNKAIQLAAQLNLPVYETTQPEKIDFLVRLTSERLELQSVTSAMKPIYVDFVSGRLAYRRHHGGGRKQLLARAVGIRGQIGPVVLDVTAGLGRDAFVLACLGCRVQMLERSPIIGALLQDGLQRLAAAGEKLFLALTQIDACHYMRQLNDDARPDVVYVDPMYPPNALSTLVKKELRILREIVGSDQDAPTLLKSALQCARKRVVVKRPYAAPIIDNPVKPSLVFSGKSSRFDVYLLPTNN